MILFRDYTTTKKSLTVTGLIFTFLMTLFCFAGVALGYIADSILWPVLAFHGSYIAIYWNKRLRASAGGLEFGGKDE